MEKLNLHNDFIVTANKELDAEEEHFNVLMQLYVDRPQSPVAYVSIRVLENLLGNPEKIQHAVDDYLPKISESFEIFRRRPTLLSRLFVPLLSNLDPIERYCRVLSIIGFKDPINNNTSEIKWIISTVLEHI